MSTKNNASIYWYIEPLDAYTNEVIAKNLLALSQLDENVALFDQDGKEHSVFQVESHMFITRLYKDRFKLGLRFNVYQRRNSDSPIRIWKFADPDYQISKKRAQASKRLPKTGNIKK